MRIATTSTTARSLSEILRIIAAAPISEYARRTASEIFLALGAAEAKVHNVGVEQIHFHEVGAADAIVDIVCAAVGAEALEVDQFVASPLNVGGGTVACAHGVMPVPAPATLRTAEERADLFRRHSEGAGHADRSGHRQSVSLKLRTSADHDHGTHWLRRGSTQLCRSRQRAADHASARPRERGLRLRQRRESEAAEEEIAILEANLDDLNPQLIGYIVDLAFAEGALDVFTTPVQMKKNRPGTVLTVLARPEHEAQVARAVVPREQHAGRAHAS